MTEFRFDAPGALFFRPEGPLDAIGVLACESHVETITDISVEHITIDLSDVSFMDPSGLGLLVDIAKRMKMRGGEFVIRGVHGQPQRMLERLNLMRPLNVQVAPETSARPAVAAYAVAQAA
ncbi:MAG: STAS domain-containing protein [Minwuia sp.]|nr:STAS domain-containing protein [Minwuia sp.]